ncbi:MAG: GIY-YIG nuclease family protein [Nostoc sp. NMS7]|uniref:GIY-YIG nuclease family protein n=1 Tax=Nostoc sp. NMS7 TaxID=2815391 RepID=UPI0025D1055C|nr:GIY-YIG nuclease family protein [Nostoc sp. NMS7]MBN3948450.1 GIY-YIG nuclease family protein [Nostoc sp. NMS7]
MSNADDRIGWIYLINAVGTNRYKIGKTSSISRRVAELTYQSPYPLEIVMYFQSNYPSADERALHRKFANSRVHGEWFEFDFLTTAEFYPIGSYTILSAKYLSKLSLVAYSKPSSDIKNELKRTIIRCLVSLFNKNIGDMYITGLYKALEKGMIRDSQEIQQEYNTKTLSIINTTLLYWLEAREKKYGKGALHCQITYQNCNSHEPSSDK